MTSSAFGPRAFLNLLVHDASRLELSFVQMADSLPVGPNEIILASSPFLLNLIGPPLVK